MLTFTVQYDDTALRTMLFQLQMNLSNIQPALTSIGNLIKEETRLNFTRQSDPWGVPWKPLSIATLMERRAKGRGGAKILRDTGVLMNTITRNVYPNLVEVGTPTTYGKYHQRGWGVPRREFLGVNQRMETEILSILQKHLSKIK